MANISSFVVDGVSYAYDTESKNPLGIAAKKAAFEGTLVYGTDGSGYTAIDKGEDKVITPAEKDADEEAEDEDEELVGEDEEPTGEDPVDDEV